MAYASCAARRWNRALTFATKAVSVCPNNVEAIILQGNIFIEQKKYQEALLSFRQAMQIKPHRYEPHKGLVDCFTGLRRLREALNIACSSCKLLGQTPRVLTVS